MFSFLRAGLGHAFRTKVGMALLGALLVGGGGTAMAMATSHAQLPFGAALTQSSATHSDSDGGSKTPSATKTVNQEDTDQDDQGCTGSTGSTTGTPSTHADSDDASEHASGTPSATRSAGQGDDANEHEGSQDDQDECGGKSTTTRTPMPEPTEHPEATGTPGTGGD
jgi:hypothetical protein